MGHRERGESTRAQRLRGAGTASWSILGIIALAAVIAVVLGALSGIIIPLVVAYLLGTVLEPVVTRLVRLGLPSAAAAVLGLLTALATAVALVVVIVVGFIGQLPEITRQVLRGWDAVVTWARALEIEASELEALRSGLYDLAPAAGVGLIGVVTDTVYGTITLGISAFFAMFFLFFVLKDGHRFPGWFASVTTFDPRRVALVDDAVKRSLRGYIRGTAITALVTAPIFAIPLLVLSVPLVVPILIVYFFLSFVPFIGAWLTAVFAVLIAFGSGGFTTAAIVGVALLISNGSLQSLVSSWALGSSLKIHPVALLLATMIGGVVAGVLGMVLGAPLLAAARSTAAALRAANEG